jgi:hypothetical protein
MRSGFAHFAGNQRVMLEHLLAFRESTASSAIRLL